MHRFDQVEFMYMAILLIVYVACQPMMWLLYISWTHMSGPSNLFRLDIIFCAWSLNVVVVSLEDELQG